ncbi:MAG: radical SAM protein, partial [Candidatus Omnitrophica bacterium]|nr:radical SAM protein [Candidatus Omnitrophota bacterium]
GGKLEGIEGLGYREGGRICVNGDRVFVENLDDIYQSRDFGWDLVKDKVNFRQVPYFINLYTSRGCHFSCSFCYLMDIKEMKPSLRYRRRSPENVIREIEYLNKNFGINVFTFGDDDFLYNIKEIYPLLEYFRKNKLYIEHFWTNINNLSPENIELLKGICQTVCYSVEATSPKLQKVLNKYIPTEKVLKVNKLLRDVGINVVHNFLFGIPTEKDEDTKQNIDLMKAIKKVNPYFRANCYILSPIPGTPIFEFGKKLSGKDIQWTFTDLGNYHFRYMNESAAKFRPYLSAEDNAFYERVTVLANELFTEINAPATEAQKAEIAGSKRLSFVFGDLDEIRHPDTKKKKYILNEVIAAAEKKEALPQITPF